MPQKRVINGKTRWIGRYRDSTGKAHSKSFDLRREAAEYEALQKRGVRRGEWIDPNDKTTLVDLARSWAGEARTQNTRNNRISLLKNLGELGAIPLHRIEPSAISDWQSVCLSGRPWKGGRPLAASTVAVMTGQVAGLLEQAVDDGLIVRVPRVPGPKAPPRQAVSRSQLISPEEIRALLEIAMYGHRNARGPATPPRPWLARMILVAVGTGMRCSEVCGLHPEDVDEVRQTVTVARQARPGGMSTGPTKTGRSRVIPVAEATVGVLRESLTGSQGGGPVFPGPGGHVYHDRQSVGSAMRRLSDVAGLRRRFTFHDFRHYYASVLIAHGCPVNVVQHALGHASPSITLETYTHLWPGQDGLTRAGAERAVELVGDFCGIFSDPEGDSDSGDRRLRSV